MILLMFHFKKLAVLVNTLIDTIENLNLLYVFHIDPVLFQRCNINYLN